MRTRTNHRLLFIAVALVILASLACNAPAGEEPTPIIIVLSPTASTPQTTGDDTPTPTPPTAPAATVAPVPTDTPVPDVSGPGGCALNAAFVADVTVLDDTQFDPGEAFTKVWRVRNSGTCAWEVGTKLVFVSGDPMGGPTAVAVTTEIDPESNVDLSVDFVAPDTPGTYRSTWRLRDPDGTQFGSHVYVQIVVPEPATDTPTPTEELDPPDLVITDLEIDTDDLRQGIPLDVVATLYNQGEQTAEDFYWTLRVCVEDDCEYVTSSDHYTLEPDEEIVVEMEYTFEKAADYTVEATVDDDDEIEESDDTNNTRQLLVSITSSLPDLVVDAITFNPDPPVQGQNTTVQITVRNRGSKPANAFVVEWWSDEDLDDPACDWSIVSVAANDTVGMQCTFSYTDWYDEVTTRAIADAGGDVDELYETNNSLDKDTPVNQP